MTTPSQVVLPQIIVDAAMNAGAPVAAAGTFILDDAANGLLDTGILGEAATAWQDISDFVLGFAVNRPSTRVQGPLIQFQAATATVTLDNSTGIFDPDNLAGPFVVGGVSQVRAMVPVRIRALFGGTEYAVSRTFADSWAETAVDYDAGYSEWTVGSTDAFKILAGINLASGGAVGGGEATGARVGRLLTLAGWYSGAGDGARKLAAGDSTLQAVTLDGNVLDLMQQAVDSEIGQMYMDGSGAVVFRNRTALLSDTRSNASQATFGDNPAGSELPCAAVGRANDDTTIANDIQAAIANGGVLQEAQDAQSVATYLFPRTYSRTDLILQDNPTALLWAQWVLYVSKTAEDRFDTVTVDPAAQPSDLWPQVLGRQIGDRITVIRRPQNSGVTITKDVFITGIAHTFDSVTSAWQTTWTLADASRYGSFFTLDSAILGVLDTDALPF